MYVYKICDIILGKILVTSRDKNEEEKYFDILEIHSNMELQRLQSEALQKRKLMY